MSSRKYFIHGVWVNLYWTDALKLKKVWIFHYGTAYRTYIHEFLLERALFFKVLLVLTFQILAE